jgi:hypothetical protein
MAAREAELLPVPYFHIVFTLPAAIGDIAYQNKAVIYHLLFKAASETMLTIAADPKHLGARIGITAVLHTWGSAMTHHPHIHMAVPGGGLAPDGSRRVHGKPNFFLPVRVLAKLFRRLMLEKLAAAHQAPSCNSSAPTIIGNRQLIGAGLDMPAVAAPCGAGVSRQLTLSHFHIVLICRKRAPFPCANTHAFACPFGGCG